MNDIKKWKLNVNGIAKSIESVLKTGDSDKLTKDAYNFVMNISGFIAHYDINGFKSYYSNTADLLKDLSNSSDCQFPDRYINDSFFSKSEQSAYYSQKTELLKIIRSLCDKYALVALNHEKEEIETKFLSLKNFIESAQGSLDLKGAVLKRLKLI